MLPSSIISHSFFSLSFVHFLKYSVTFILLGVGIPMGLSKEGRKNSKYMSMIEGRHGDLAPADAHAHH